LDNIVFFFTNSNNFQDPYWGRGRVVQYTHQFDQTANKTTTVSCPSIHVSSQLDSRSPVEWRVHSSLIYAEVVTKAYEVS
jgi:hypothetical protein